MLIERIIKYSKNIKNSPWEKALEKEKVFFNLVKDRVKNCLNIWVFK